MIGETVGNFRIVSKIGRGGMGDVFQAEHLSGGTRVAIKVLKSDLSADNEYVQRLFNEARAVNEIRHSGVVQVFDVGMDSKGRAYLVMELLEGDTLGRTLSGGNRLSFEQVLSIARQTALALEATHAVGITHRDLKPENIFLVPDREPAGGLRVKILDFGIAKLTGTLKGGFPTTQVSLGTPAYMAPEQWGDPSRIDGRVDLYALGCVLFEMVCGRPPFPSTTMAEACAAHVSLPPPRARSIAAHVPPALDALIDGLLAKTADTRALPRDVVQVCDTLVRGSAPTLATPGDPRMTQPTGFPGRARTAPVYNNATTTDATELPPPPPGWTELPPPPPGWGEVAGAPPRRNTGRALLIVLGLGGLVAGVIVVVAVVGGDKKPAVKSENDKVDLRANRVEKPVDAAVNERMAEAIAAIAATNPWTERNGVPILTHFVWMKEYSQYLAALPPADVPAATPLASFDAAGTRPVRWVTWEQADRFCKAIGAKLLTDDRWETLVGKTSDGKLNFGDGMREWTSTRTNAGGRVVRGAFTELAPEAIEAERPWSFPRDTEASAGGRDVIEKVASTEISFRCTK